MFFVRKKVLIALCLLIGLQQSTAQAVSFFNKPYTYAMATVAFVAAWTGFKYLHRPGKVAAEHKTLEPSDAVVAFDFHDVVVHRDNVVLSKNIMNLFWNINNKKEILADSYGIMNDAYALKKQKNVDVISQLVQKHPSLKNYEQSLHEVVAQSHVLSKETVVIINDLKSSGYKVYMASNISQQSFDAIKKGQKELETLFDGHFYPSSTNKAHALYTQEAKPKTEYFTGLRQFLIDEDSENANKVIIFVDDNQKNIQGALASKSNFVGIRYTSGAQLKADLKTNGIEFKDLKS